MVFLRRTRRGPDPHLWLKYAGFVAGAALALAGIALEIGWLVTAAIVVLAAVMLYTRVVRRSGPPG